MAARSIWRPFVAFRSILENCLLEEFYLELKITLKNVIKVFQEGYLPITKKNIQMHLRRFFNAVFHALSESVFIFFLSCLELIKLEVKDLAYVKVW